MARPFDQDKDAPGAPERFSEQSLIDRVGDVDRQILALFGRRARLLAKAPLGKRSGRNAAADSLERRLWARWEEDAARYGHNPGLWRKIFTLLQDMTVRSAEEAAAKGQGFRLSPRPRPVDIAMPGPGDAAFARMWAMLAAGAPAAGALPGAVANTPLVDLLKALNLAGATMYWSESGLGWRGLAAGLEFGGKVIHVGDDPFNATLLLCRALTANDRVKVLGGSALRLHDFSELKRVFPLFGARLTSIAPHTPGVPMRLETSGLLPDSLEAGDLSDEVLAALAMAGPFFPRGLTLLNLGSGSWPALFEQALGLLEQCGLPPERAAGTVVIKPGQPVLPQAPALPLDPYITPYLLALPLGAGGQICLSGHGSPQDGGRLAQGFELLKAGGAALTVSGQTITLAVAEAAPNQATLPVGQVEEYVPLALFLAVNLLESGAQTEVRIVAAPDRLDWEAMGEFLGRVSGRAEAVEDGLLVTKQPEEQPEITAPWTCPGPYWAVALALASLVRPGLALANPGILTDLYPDFWPIYNSLSKKPAAPEEQPPDEDNTPPAGKRRIII